MTEHQNRPTIASSEQEAASTLGLAPESVSRCLPSLTQALANQGYTMLDSSHAARRSLMSVIRHTEQVLRYHAVAVQRGDRLVLTHYRQALADVCERLRRDSSGLQALDQIQALLPGICAPEPQHEVINGMEKAISQYQSWLQTIFPRECSPVCRWPILKAFRGSVPARCEQCGKRGAKVHISDWSGDGVVRHEYCNECYRKLTEVDHKFG